ncbi:protein SUPPRESSOR OF K(+) TRANSPORT GROWTH DEFECT 1-like [Quercus robur]|uniref:protein SUPPRESSOR OF K(+) TRANSPORT GROWTH DEFECT 1-like n=1 Tax=Quercus robur TaxID=38942 RepID=UPI002161FCEF|nr:protein SUPPRESSOR OF K(+) TRANSPORT GROWTH DEFECT 1-like [Quercus robur]
MTDDLRRLLAEVDETVEQAVKADNNCKNEIAYDYYKKAFEQLNHFGKVFDQTYLPHYKRAEDIARKLPPGSSITDTAQLWRFPTYSSPKLSHFVKLSNVELDDVGGLEDCKQVLMEAAIWPKEYPHFFTGNRKPWRAVLLFGPPGSGKTLLAKAIAAKANFHFYSISPSDIVSKWMGESEQQVSDLFQEARKKAPSIIFIDEIDSLCGPRGENNENEASRQIKSELLVHMQGVCDGAEHVLILAATNTPYDLDKAIRRRFDMRIYIPLPNEKARKHIFKVQIGETPNSIAKEELKHLAKDTEGFSGSDISYYVKDALYQSIRATLRADFCIKTKKKSLRQHEKDKQNSEIQVPEIEFAHFNEVRERHKPTVKKKYLKRLEDFKNEFGVSGEM